MSNPRRTGFQVGRALLVLASVSALLATFEAVSGLTQAGSDTLMLEAWRAFGLAVFAGIFGLLAWRPTGFPGVLELAIAHKAALTAMAFASPEAAGAGTVLVADGLLTLALVAAFVLVGRHRLWRRGEAVSAPGDPRPPRLDVAESRSAGSR